MEEDKNVYYLFIYRYLIVVDEPQNYKLHLLICHHINEVVRLEVVDVVVEAVININIMNKEIILTVELNRFIL
jgi:hypothetical protein